jgi:class 3 adenylate cyclase
VALCTKCAQPNPDLARFCNACGAPIAADGQSQRKVRKQVTTVFVDIRESTQLAGRLDPESLRHVVERYFDRMRTTAERHGGTVEKFIGDAVVAVFGIPIVHEDDALRALKAAAEMRESVEVLNDELQRDAGVMIQIGVGVNTGEVLAGDSTTGQSFATGAALHVAAKLQQAARGGEILIGETTFRLVQNAVRADPIEPLRVKGKNGAVPAYRLRSIEHGTGAISGREDSPFVGRDRELGSLTEVFERVVGTQACQVVTVVGSAGIGKSRLIQEFLALLTSASIVRGHCLPYGDGITFWPVKEAVAQAAGLSGGESAEDARGKIRALVAGATDADLVVERVAETIDVAETGGGHTGNRWAIGRLFEELARQRPLIAVFDDIHWAEPTFLDLVAYVATKLQNAPALIICLGRPEVLDAHPDWGDPAYATTLLLEPLSDPDCRHMITTLLGATRLDDKTRMQITDAAEGNPFFVEQLVANLADAGTVAVPPTIQALLAARLDSLDPDERDALERGSVEGKAFHGGALAELTPAPSRSRLDELLNQLIDKGFIRPDRAVFADEPGYRFRHQLLRDAAYESLPKERRADLHERFATWLEVKAAGRAGEHEEILGYHLEQSYRNRVDVGPADEPTRAIGERAASRLGTAGLRAHARGDMPAAASLLSRAVDLLPGDSEERSRLWPRLLEARFEIGELRQVHMSRASLRCFWHWPFGHRWAVRQSRGRGRRSSGELLFRCADCGKTRVRRKPWGINEDALARSGALPDLYTSGADGGGLGVGQSSGP